MTAPLPDLDLSPASAGDVAELLVLQRCCWVSEAISNQTLDIPPLHESRADVDAWIETWTVRVVRRRGRLVAAVRARVEHGWWEVGRLMVAPDLAGHGVGRWLLAEAEALAPPGVRGALLFTGSRSARNLRLYRAAGYVDVDPPPGFDRIPGVIHLVKPSG